MTDESGSFQLDALPAGAWALSIAKVSSVDAQANGLVVARQMTIHHEIVEVVSGGEIVLAYNWDPLAVDVLVLDEAGDPVSEAGVTTSAILGGGVGGGIGPSGMTDSDGRLQLQVLEPGTFFIHSQHPTAGAGSTELIVERGGDTPSVTVQLRGPVPCAGEIVLLEGVQLSGRNHSLGVAPMAGGYRADPVRLDFVNGRASFKVEGLRPGRFRADLWTGTEPLAAFFDLPEEGATNLILEFDSDD